MNKGPLSSVFLLSPQRRIIFWYRETRTPNTEWTTAKWADLITAKAAPGDCLLVNDTVTFMPAPMRPVLAARPDAYRKLIDLTRWERATDRNDVFDTNLIPEVVATPLSQCRVVWIITQADESIPAHEQGPAIPPGPVYGPTSAFAVP